ncbi:MAG: tetratricopeptide repeat protein [Gammaproteobacteria bacterium]|nr:tetratricopeptide repeat protein [Gammaproteobacteria bacterium]
MTGTTENIQELAQQAFSTLQSGKNQQAREIFEGLVSSGRADATIVLGLAHACFRLEDKTSALAAVDSALEMEPTNLRVLLFKADFLEQDGQSRSALEYYQHALALAANHTEMTEDVKQGLQRAEQACARKDREYKTFLEAKLKDDGYKPSRSNLRFQQSIDLIFGEKEVFYQEPRRYYYPGLPQIQFYEREQFAWLNEMEASADKIRNELTEVLAQPETFSPYLQADSNHLGRYDDGLLNSEDWSALYLWEHGKLIKENAQLFPQTIEALKLAPLPEIRGQAPMALFSKLKAETHIPPHNGVLNTRLICHLPIIVPERCGALRVGNEERRWHEGETLIFDDSIQHEAWNHSKEERVVLLFEIWRPELNEEERELVTLLLAAVKEYHHD